MADTPRIPVVFNTQRKRGLVSAAVGANLLLTTLTPVVLSTVQVRNPTYTQYKQKHAVQVIDPQNLLQGTLGTAVPPIQAKPTTDSQVYRKHLGPILYGSRGVDPQAPIVPTVTSPFVPPPFESVYRKKIVYNLVHWNAQGSELDFEPIAASVPESLEPQRRLYLLPDTSLNSVNSKLYATAQAFTFNVSGGITYSGDALRSLDKSFEPSGILTLSGNAITGHTESKVPTGAITFSGTNTLTFYAQGSAPSITRIPLTGAGQT